MIKSSATPDVPWGYVCGYPTRSGGDLYGGAWVGVQSAAAEGRDATPQGLAIKNASIRFGDGRTLPYPPCKRGYIPIVRGVRMYGCHIHHEARMKRVRKEDGKFRRGEQNLAAYWGSQSEAERLSLDVKVKVRKNETPTELESIIEVKSSEAKRHIVDDALRTEIDNKKGNSKKARMTSSFEGERDQNITRSPK